MATIEPLINPYLWAIGPVAERLPPGSEVGDTRTVNRYQVIAPQVWLDTQAGQSIPSTETLYRELLPYHYLHPLRLHLPVVYGVCHNSQGIVVLLENAPIEGAGVLLPRLDLTLSQASSLRQIHWLWQLLELWSSLAAWGVAASLLVPENLRVQGGIVRLRELYGGMGKESPLGADLDSPFERYTDADTPLPTLGDLGRLWRSWLPRFAVDLQPAIEAISYQLEEGTIEFILEQMNRLLLHETARSPLKLTIAAQTHQGRSHQHNEDSCFPLPHDLANATDPSHQALIPHVAIVCDGIGGHEGGEVASQLALRSMKLQLQALFQNLQTQPPGTLLPPFIIQEQLAASIRVVNNLITAQNDLQRRSDRQRMGTTLVMAIHLQQRLSDRPDHLSHEIYLAHVGDSRAYWMSQRYYHGLTVDDDVAGREVRMGRSLYRAALDREDAQSLTQALGTRAGEDLHLHLQRFIVDEDGVFVLCSDGLSDNGWVERYWHGSITALLTEMKTLEGIVQEWVDVGNQKNGQDNISVAVMKCRISPDYPILLDPFPDAAAPTGMSQEEAPIAPVPTEAFGLSINPEDDLTAASAALLAETADLASPSRPAPRLAIVGVIFAFLLILALGGALLFLWPKNASWQDLWRDRFPQPEATPKQTSPL